MAKRMIIYETIDGEKEILSTIAIDKIKLENIVSFTIIDEDDVIEKYVIGVPFTIDKFDVSHGLYNMISQWRRCDFTQILYTYGKLSSEEDANYYIDAITNLPMKKEDNMYILTSRAELINLLKSFLEENERSIDEQVKPKSRVKAK